MSRYGKHLLTLIFVGLAMTLTAGVFAQVESGGSVGYLRSQSTWGAGIVAAAYFLGLALSGIGSATGLSKAVASALDGTARQPEAAGDLRVTMIIGCALIEALTIYMLISPFLAGGLLIN
jgi:F-type H+-transporting ATPase subunit c